MLYISTYVPFKATRSKTENFFYVGHSFIEVGELGAKFTPSELTTQQYYAGKEKKVY